MAKTYPVYPIGTPGQPWGETEKKQWLERQSKKRDYFVEVLSPLMRANSGELFQYGSLDYRPFGSACFPLMAIRSRNWAEGQTLVVVTGGVHGYETSGVQGALLFVQKQLAQLAAEHSLNILVLPCVSPWGYEVIQRWTPYATDPNRCFKADTEGCLEAAQAMACIKEHAAKSKSTLAHFDLHETTDSDNNEFRPSKIARDGETSSVWSAIPDGFFLVTNTHNNARDWNNTILNEGVAPITHLAPSDENGNIIGEKATDPAVITIDGRQWGICGAHTDAKFSVTTEVYPDSANATAQQCNLAQEAVVATGIRAAMGNQ